jgi:uncharacterized membrane protein YbhN (UPF0104 family)
MKALIKSILAVSLVVFIVGYLYAHRTELQVLTTIEVVDVFLVSLVLFLFFCASGLTYALLCGLVGVRLTPVETVGLSFLTNMVNYLAPLRPGLAAKAVYLKAAKDLNFSSFSSVFAANAFLLLFVTAATGSLLIVLLYLDSKILSVELLLFSLAGVLVGGAPFVFRRAGKIIDVEVVNASGVRRWLQEAVEGFREIRGNPSGIMLVCVSVLLQFVLSAVLMHVLYHGVGIEITLLQAFVIGVFTAFSNLFSVTPNNIGVQELVMAYLFSVLGADFSSGLLGASILRAIHLVLTFSLGTFLVWMMLSRAGLTLSVFSDRQN